MDIAVIGSNMVDLVSYLSRMPDEGETVEAWDFSMGCGGKGANQAMAAARMGSSVLMLTRIGNDAFGETTRSNFEANGIDTTYVLETEATSGVAPIFVDDNSRNSIVIAKGANAFLTPGDIEDAAEAISQCSLIVLQLEVNLETVYAAIDFGNRHGIPVLLNPAPATPELDFAQVAKCDYFVPNETELALLTGMPVETLDQVQAAAGSILDHGVKNVIVTMGSRGVLWLSAAGPVLVEGRTVPALDTTGAGDAFIGCFSHCLVESGDVPESLATANAYAADSVTRRGTQTSYATREQFERNTGRAPGAAA
ncbi:ribokinase [Arthrobacter sp. zg-Y1110]|uniref:ribokinase n=1 Tax=Arthrobacter sp. zg-Y1110 TaxID=2886932 RepID=UPI001D149BF8|nr:ribokinase [Arthrobacter sp. zg-Y1110]MCC3291851.1 ribokinase [Arthrobacter sp. zg-Y1110]UWX85679.1 ribokinase [Arthrobacter sp. zg-Y1110]